MCWILQNSFGNLDPATFVIGNLRTKYTDFFDEYQKGDRKQGRVPG
jgi:hypothetical protein